MKKQINYKNRRLLHNFRIKRSGFVFVGVLLIISIITGVMLFLSYVDKKPSSAASISFANGQVSIDKKYYQNNSEVSSISTIPGAEITTRLKYNNTGEQAALNTQITDSLPIGFTYVPGSLKNCYVDIGCVSLSDSLINPSGALACPSGYTYNGTQCEQRVGKIAASTCPPLYVDDSGAPPCVAVSPCPNGWTYNSGSNLCGRNFSYSQKCFSGDLPDVSGTCSYQQMPLFDCATNAPGQVQVFDSTSGYNNPGLKLCTKTPQYFATGSCAGTFDAANADTYTNIAWLSSWSGNVYDNGDRLDAIMNYQNRVPAGSSQTGQYMSDNFCAVANGVTGGPITYNGNGCPANFRPLLDKGSRTHALTFPSNDQFGANYSPNPLTYLCISKSFATGAATNSSAPNITVVHGGVGDSVVNDRFCGPNEIGQTWDGFGKTNPFYPAGVGHNDRVRLCGSFSYTASVPYCQTGTTGIAAGLPQYQCYESQAPSDTCVSGFTLLTSDPCTERVQKVPTAICPVGFVEELASPPCVSYTNGSQTGSISLSPSIGYFGNPTNVGGPQTFDFGKKHFLHLTECFETYSNGNVNTYNIDSINHTANTSLSNTSTQTPSCTTNNVLTSSNVSTLELTGKRYLHLVECYENIGGNDINTFNISSANHVTNSSTNNLGTLTPNCTSNQNITSANIRSMDMVGNRYLNFVECYETSTGGDVNTFNIDSFGHTANTSMSNSPTITPICTGQSNCPSGHSWNGTQCEQRVNTVSTTTYTCPNGGTLSGVNCTNLPAFTAEVVNTFPGGYNSGTTCNLTNQYSVSLGSGIAGSMALCVPLSIPSITPFKLNVNGSSNIPCNSSQYEASHTVQILSVFGSMGFCIPNSQPGFTYLEDGQSCSGSGNYSVYLGNLIGGGTLCVPNNLSSAATPNITTNCPSGYTNVGGTPPCVSYTAATNSNITSSSVTSLDTLDISRGYGYIEYKMKSSSSTTGLFGTNVTMTGSFGSVTQDASNTIDLINCSGKYPNNWQINLTLSDAELRSDQDFTCNFHPKICPIVFYDLNNDGVKSSNENNIPGQQIQLYRSDGLTLVTSLTTDSGGNTCFDSLAGGGTNYKIVNPNPVTIYNSTGGDVKDTYIASNDVTTNVYFGYSTGVLSLTVPASVVFPASNTSRNTQTVCTEVFPITVSDNRLDQPGWSVTGVVDNFTVNGESKTLPVGGKFRSEPGTVNVVSGQAGPQAGATKTVSSPTSSFTVFTAGSGVGVGEYTINQGICQTLDPYTVSGNYQTVITYTII